MADEDWLKFDNTGGAYPTQHADQNQEVQIESGYDSNENGVHDAVDSPKSSKCSCCTRRRLIVSIICFTLVAIGAALGVYFTVLSPSNLQDSSKTNGATSNSKNKLGNDHVSAPTPADIQYSVRATVSPGPTSSNAFQAADIINSVARKGGEEFKDPNSYQSLAKKWVMTQDFPVPDGSSLNIEQQVIQLYALACIYYGTFSVKSEWTDVHYGPDVALPGWYSSRGWLETAENVCSNWHGLSCNGEGRIVKIELDTNGLTGAFPPESALLHETLNTIDLFNNMVHNAGDEGHAFFGELTNLEYLYVGTTSFEYDGVPSVLGKLTALKELDFSKTLYFGSLDGAVFSKLSNLRYLNMDENAYNSSIPSELAQLPNLEYLYAGFSFIEGGLDFLTSMQKVVEVWVDDNPNLKGTIPSDIGKLENLASFSASNCGLTGTIPTEIGTATSMIQMWLNDNNLTGEIPPEIANLVTMKILEVQNNGLSGMMPSTICARKRPFGRLEELGADCDGAIACGEDCCTCCGDQCSSL